MPQRRAHSSSAAVLQRGERDAGVDPELIFRTEDRLSRNKSSRELKQLRYIEGRSGKYPFNNAISEEGIESISAFRMRKQRPYAKPSGAAAQKPVRHLPSLETRLLHIHNSVDDECTALVALPTNDILQRLDTDDVTNVWENSGDARVTTPKRIVSARSLAPLPHTTIAIEDGDKAVQDVEMMRLQQSTSHLLRQHLNRIRKPEQRKQDSYQFGLSGRSLPSTLSKHLLSGKSLIGTVAAQTLNSSSENTGRGYSSQSSNVEEVLYAQRVEHHLKCAEFQSLVEGFTLGAREVVPSKAVDSEAEVRSPTPPLLAGDEDRDQLMARVEMAATNRDYRYKPPTTLRNTDAVWLADHADKVEDDDLEGFSGPSPQVLQLIKDGAKQRGVDWNSGDVDGGEEKPAASKRRSRRVKIKPGLSKRNVNSSSKLGTIFPSWLQNRPDFNSFIDNSDHIICRQALDKAPEQRMKAEFDKLCLWFRSNAFFKSQSLHMQQEICRVATIQKVSKGEVLHKRGDTAEAIYMVLEGMCLEQKELIGPDAITAIRSTPAALWRAGHSHIVLSSNGFAPLEKECASREISGSSTLYIAQHESEAEITAKLIRSGGTVGDALLNNEPQFRGHHCEDLSGPMKRWAKAAYFQSLLRQSILQEKRSESVSDTCPARRNAVALTDCLLVNINLGYVRDAYSRQREHEIRESVRWLRRLPFIRRWTYRRVKTLASAMSVRVCEPGDVLARQNANPSSLFVLAEGVVEIHKDVEVCLSRRWPVSSTEWELKRTAQRQTFCAGHVPLFSMFGVEALLSMPVREFSYTCKSKVTVLELDQTHLTVMFQKGTIALLKQQVCRARLDAIDAIKKAVAEKYPNPYHRNRAVPESKTLAEIWKAKEDQRRLILAERTLKTWTSRWFSGEDQDFITEMRAYAYGDARTYAADGEYVKVMLVDPNNAPRRVEDSTVVHRALIFETASDGNESGQGKGDGTPILKQQAKQVPNTKGFSILVNFDAAILDSRVSSIVSN